MFLVSIIIPVFNTPTQHIKSCIKSVLRQTYVDFEIIIVDDGSDEDCSVALEMVKKDDNRICLIRQKNAGVSSARNLGMQLAKGEYVAFVDSDDEVASTYLEEAISLLEQENLDIVVGSRQEIHAKYIKTVLPPSSNEQIAIYDSGDRYLSESMIIGAAAPQPSLLNTPFGKIYRKSCLKDYQFDTSLSLGEDFIFNLNVIRRAGRVGVVRNIWYYYNMLSFSATHKFRPDGIEEGRKTLLKCRKFIEDNEEHFLLNAYYVRTLLFFVNAMNSTVFHPKADRRRKIADIRELINDEIYCEAFQKVDLTKVNVLRRFKILAWMGKRNMASAIWLMFTFSTLRRARKYK